MLEIRSSGSELLAFYSEFGFRYSFVIRHSGFVINQSDFGIRLALVIRAWSLACPCRQIAQQCRRALLGECGVVDGAIHFDDLDILPQIRLERVKEGLVR